MAIADGEAIGRAKFELTEVSDTRLVFLEEYEHFDVDVQRMLQPCGPPPKKEDE